MTGALEFATCFHETAYTDAAIERGSLSPGDTMCVRTDGRRERAAVEFGATVWDPPVPW